jgi:predicted transcriptional regulator
MTGLSMKKIALIGDIVKSRELSDRREIQTKLKRKLTSINKKSDSLLSPLTITLGDEFQAVYKNADGIFSNIFEILTAVHPLQIRFTLGVGEISTSINKKSAIGMDGEAFYIARDNMNSIKKNGSLINIGGVNGSVETIVNLNLKLISNQINDWNFNRLQIFFNLLKGENNYSRIAKSLSISERAVYKSIRSGSLDVIVAMFKEITELINSSIKNDK